MTSALDRIPSAVAVQRTATIRAKNGAFRSHFVGGRVLVTQGVIVIAEHTRRSIVTAVQTLDDFSPSNDPYGEHDFGAVTINDVIFFWKIDYYDRGLQHSSPDPANDAVTCRGLTIMRAEEYRAVKTLGTVFNIVQALPFEFTLPSRLTSSFHRFGPRIAFGNSEKSSNVRRQCIRQPRQKINRCIEITTFDSAYGRSVNASVNSKILLRYTLCGSDFSKIPADTLTMIHRDMATTLPSVNP